MKINEIEALVGVTKKNIRFYEEQGLLTPCRNSENGYRDYGSGEVAILQRIKLMRKLGVPISEIKSMQTGVMTVGDAMRRHLVTLERERENIEHSVALCRTLTEREVRLEDLNAEEILVTMDDLEKTGAVFSDRQKQDIRVRYIAPVAACAVMITFMLCMVFLLGWALATDSAEAPPLPIIIFLMGCPVVVIVGVVLALRQRIKEIWKGELDDAKRY